MNGLKMNSVKIIVGHKVVDGICISMRKGTQTGILNGLVGLMNTPGARLLMASEMLK